ncbi:MAG: GFA family protein [Gammaproteobacteria bacterium AqS3]|nr:GFA family protein [Gammaproteobacteria bacterium AqS3]
MSAKIQGGCLCGHIRYQSTAEPAFVANCHCPDCKRSTGAAFATIIGVPEDDTFTITGELGYHISTGDSGGNVSRGFCRECGSPLLSRVDVSPGVVYIKAGSLDDANWVEPQMELFTETRIACAKVPEGIPTFARNPA